jgi:hypothetical protein
MPSRDTRRAQNQKLFREGNWRLVGAVDDQVTEGQVVPFLCECANADCLGEVRVSLTQWEAVASRPNTFVMERGHLRSEGEEVVGSVDEYDVVRKPD